MPERNFRTRVDRYLRREDTPLAKTLQWLSPQEGNEYRRSRVKRVSEIAIAGPAYAIALPVIGALGLMAKIEDGGPAFYLEERLGDRGETFELTKIRCMKVGANQEPWSVTHDRNQVKAEYDDPRNTRVGRVMRRVEAEELPQLGSVLAGDMSLVDVRAIAPYAHEYMQQNIRQDMFDDWDDNRAIGKPGLFSLNSAVNNSRKNDLRRVHYDRLYGRRASLGLDLFVLYRTGLRMGEKVYRKALDIARGTQDGGIQQFDMGTTCIVPDQIVLPLENCVTEVLHNELTQ